MFHLFGWDEHVWVARIVNIYEERGECVDWETGRRIGDTGPRRYVFFWEVLIGGLRRGG